MRILRNIQLSNIIKLFLVTGALFSLGCDKDDLAPSSPLNLELVGATETSMTIAWSPSSDNLKQKGEIRYHIYRASKAGYVDAKKLDKEAEKIKIVTGETKESGKLQTQIALSDKTKLPFYLAIVAADSRNFSKPSNPLHVTKESLKVAQKKTDEAEKEKGNGEDSKKDDDEDDDKKDDPSKDEAKKEEGAPAGTEGGNIEQPGPAESQHLVEPTPLASDEENERILKELNIAQAVRPPDIRFLDRKVSQGSANYTPMADLNCAPQSDNDRGARLEHLLPLGDKESWGTIKDKDFDCDHLATLFIVNSGQEEIYVMRWYIENLPVVFHLHSSVPDTMRPVVQEVFDDLNQDFEQSGLLEKIGKDRLIQLADQPTDDSPDVLETHTIRFVSNHEQNQGANVLGVTFPTPVPNTGEIVDADIEIFSENIENFAKTQSAQILQATVKAITQHTVAHEIMHALGVDHNHSTREAYESLMAYHEASHPMLKSHRLNHTNGLNYDLEVLWYLYAPDEDKELPDYFHVQRYRLPGAPTPRVDEPPATGPPLGGRSATTPSDIIDQFDMQQVVNVVEQIKAKLEQLNNAFLEPGDQRYSPFMLNMVGGALRLTLFSSLDDLRQIDDGEVMNQILLEGSKQATYINEQTTPAMLISNYIAGYFMGIRYMDSTPVDVAASTPVAVLRERWIGLIDRLSILLEKTKSLQLPTTNESVTAKLGLTPQQIDTVLNEIIPEIRQQLDELFDLVIDPR